jgi:WD40 repeat protein
MRRVDSLAADSTGEVGGFPKSTAPSTPQLTERNHDHRGIMRVPFVRHAGRTFREPVWTDSGKTPSQGLPSERVRKCSRGALLRDQLRQAAQAWQDRGRPEDLLWTGRSYRELSLWRDSYSGRLSSTEEAFAEAATKLAGRRRRRRQIAFSAGVALLLGVALITSSLWRRAFQEASRREAAQILALGRLELEDRPTAALAHALASLERADSDEARRFAVETLWRGAAAVVLSDNVNTVDFSPDGKWLAGGGSTMGVRLWSIDGGSPKALGEPDGIPHVTFSSGSDFLAAGGAKTARFWTLPEGGNLRRVELEGATRFRRGGSHLLSFSTTSERTKVVRDWSVRDADPEVLASLDLTGVADWDIDASGEWLVTGRGNGVYISPLRDPSARGSRLVGQHEADVVWVRSQPESPRIVSGDETGEIRVWSIAEGSSHLERTFRARDRSARLDPTDSWMVVTPGGGPDVAYVWDLKGPPDAEPLILRNGDVSYLNTAAIDPSGHWLVTANAIFGILWPLHSKYPNILRGQSPPLIAITFAPDGKGLVSTSEVGTVRYWPLSFEGSARARILMEDSTATLGENIAVDPVGRFVLVRSKYDARVFLVPLGSGGPRRMPDF